MKTHLFAVCGLLLTLVSLRIDDAPPVGDATLEMPTSTNKYMPIPDFVSDGMAWLANAQFENGGWGAGSHSRQDVRDPGNVQIDPATTAFSAMALMRSGSTLSGGPYRRNVVRALNYVLSLVEATTPNDPRLSTITGTQPQVKLGQNIDVSMVTQFLSLVLPQAVHDAELSRRIALALDVCLHKLEHSQDADGSWNSLGGWAGVLQSAMANSALEMGQAAGRKVDTEVLARSRSYQKSNLNEDDLSVRTDAAAGVALYSIASNQRATAQERKEAEDAIGAGVRDGRIETPVVSTENLVALGYTDADADRLSTAYKKNKAAGEMLADERVLAGFGNNGGEEFLSYMMTSESLALSGSKEYATWHDTMSKRLAKIQNADGSWSGHHCITSPVFCTAAVILAVTADRSIIRNQNIG